MNEDCDTSPEKTSSNFTPVHSKEAEQGVLGCIIIDPIYSLSVLEEAGVHVGDFWDKTHGKIFEICQGMRDDGDPIDLNTLSMKIKDLGLSAQIPSTFLSEIELNTHSPGHVEAFAKDVKDRSNARRLLFRCNQIRENLPKYPQNISTEAAELKTLIDEIEGSMFWKDPETISIELPVRKFVPEKMLPPTLAAWVEDVSDRMQCPIDYPAVAIVTALSGVVMRRVGIRPKANDNWTVVPNLWALIVGRPSAMKSPPVAAALKFLKTIEAEWNENHSANMANYYVEERAFKYAEQSFKKRIEKAWTDGNRELAIQLARELEEQKPPMPIQKRVMIGDSTYQAVGLMMQGNPHGLLMQKDELRGWMMSLIDDKNAEARSFWTSAWSGDDPLLVDRIGRDSNRVSGTAVSIIGNIQPGPLAAIVKAGSKDDGDDGFLSRFQLTVIPEDYAEKQWTDKRPDLKLEQSIQSMFRDLANSDGVSLGGMEDESGIPFVRFKSEAQEYFKETWEFLHEVARKENPQLESIIIKYGSMIPSLALLFSLADGKRGSVGLEYLKMAVLWARYLLSHARKIFGNESQLQKAIQAMAVKIKKGDLSHGMTIRDIRRAGWTDLQDEQIIQQAMSELEDLNWIRRTSARSKGRPSWKILINPKLKN